MEHLGSPRSKHSKICSEHFVGRPKKKSQHPLDPSYNPTIMDLQSPMLLDAQSKSSRRSERLSHHLKDKMNYHRICSVLGCTNTYANCTKRNPPVVFYTIPGRPYEVERRKKWISFINRKANWQPGKNSYICSDHFENNVKSTDPRCINYNPTIRPIVMGKSRQIKRKIGAGGSNHRPRPSPKRLQPDSNQKAARAPTSTIIAPSPASLLPASPKTVTFRWAEHRDFLADAIVDFMKSECQADANVTFCTEELKVHRLILSVFLPSIKRSLEAVGLPKQMTKLDLSKLAKESDDVRKMIEFIYTGRATVPENRLESLRRLAASLQFEGLINTIDEERCRASSLDCSLNPLDMCDAIMMKDESDSDLLPNINHSGDKGIVCKNYTRIFECKQCAQVFPDTAFLKQHRNTVHKDPSEANGSRCKLCSREFASIHSLRSHFQSKHSSSMCRWCGRRFIGHKNLEAMLYHERVVHMGIVPGKLRWCYVKVAMIDAGGNTTSSVVA